MSSANSILIRWSLPSCGQSGDQSLYCFIFDPINCPPRVETRAWLAGKGDGPNEGPSKFISIDKHSRRFVCVTEFGGMSEAENNVTGDKALITFPRSLVGVRISAIGGFD